MLTRLGSARLQARRAGPSTHARPDAAGIRRVTPPGRRAHDSLKKLPRCCDPGRFARAGFQGAFGGGLRAEVSVSRCFWGPSVEKRSGSGSRPEGKTVRTHPGGFRSAPPFTNQRRHPRKRSGRPGKRCRPSRKSVDPQPRVATRLPGGRPGPLPFPAPRSTRRLE